MRTSFWGSALAGLLLVALAVGVYFFTRSRRDRSPNDTAPTEKPAAPRPSPVLAVAGEGGFEYRIYRAWPFDGDEAKRRQRETARDFGIPVTRSFDLGDGVTLELILVPAGEFDMGSNEDMHKYAEPLHRVRITRPFYVGRCEVTQEQWRKLMGNNPSHFKGERSPVESVSWDACQRFIGKLNALVEEAGTFRLLTQAEWEYACRAGSAGKWYFGDDEKAFPEYAWFGAGFAEGSPHPVGGKKPNAWGLYDMHGNVWEWCSDWHDWDDPGSRVLDPRDDPQGPPTGVSRVIHGGYWESEPKQMRSSNVVAYEPWRKLPMIGFRVVFAIGEPYFSPAK